MAKDNGLTRVRAISICRRAGGLRRACAAAAACVVIATAAPGGDAALARGGAAVPRTAGDDAVAVDARAPPRWSDRRECPAWRANSLENIVPENLPRPSARRGFNSTRRRQFFKNRCYCSKPE